MRYIWLWFASFFIASHLFAAPIIIATSGFDPPFEIAADNKGHFFGFEIDMMNEICKRLNEKCVYKAYIFKKILSETLAGKVDLAMDAITISADRQRFFLFSLPYLVSRARLLTLADSQLHEAKQINGKRVGVVSGTLFASLANSMYKDVTIVDYDTQNDLFQAVANGSVDVVFLDDATATYWVNNNNNLFKVIGKSINLGSGYALMANASKFELIKRVNKAMIDMQNDGTYLKIYGQYF